MPSEREVSVQISVGAAMAGLCWIVSGCMLACGTWMGHVAMLAWGLAVMGIAATAQVRHWFCRQNRIFRNAFELGRDAGARPNGEATPLRRP